MCCPWYMCSVGRGSLIQNAVRSVDLCQCHGMAAPAAAAAAAAALWFSCWTLQSVQMRRATLGHDAPSSQAASHQYVWALHLVKSQRGWSTQRRGLLTAWFEKSLLDGCMQPSTQISTTISVFALSLMHIIYPGLFSGTPSTLGEDKQWMESVVAIFWPGCFSCWVKVTSLFIW